MFFQTRCPVGKLSYCVQTLLCGKFDRLMVLLELAKWLLERRWSSWIRVESLCRSSLPTMNLQGMQGKLVRSTAAFLVKLMSSILVFAVTILRLVAAWF